MENMVELRSVTKRYAGFTAVSEIDLQIHAGEFLTLLGPSGCGKTTLLRMISGFETPTEGTVWLAGNDVTHFPPYRRNVNQVFQSYALFPHLTAEQNIAYGVKAHNQALKLEKASEMLSLFHIEHIRRRIPREMSGGEQQRVALARALASDPLIVLLDEPLSAVDFETRSKLLDEIENAQSRTNIPFVYVTHNKAEAERLGKYRIILQNGQLVNSI